MSPPTRATPRCAARCAERIDLAPSRRLAFCAWLWMAAMCGVVLVAAVPLAARLAVCAVLAWRYARCVRGAIALRGPRSVRALGWMEEGGLAVWLGGLEHQPPTAATLAPGSFRLGTHLLVLTLATDTGRRAVLVDGRAQDAAAFRRLCGRLEWPPRPRSRRVQGLAVTIRRKV